VQQTAETRRERTKSSRNDLNAAEAVRNAHSWFEAHSGWAPPDTDTLADWIGDGVCRCPDDCLVAPQAWCQHGLASWWLVLSALDPIAGAEPFHPALLMPDSGRLDPSRSDYAAIIMTHKLAVEAGESNYPDPSTGLLVMTARYLWDRGRCCDQGCRHCPYVAR
jgi:Family of unknown function (DUF5522)